MIGILESSRAGRGAPSWRDGQKMPQLAERVRVERPRGHARQPEGPEPLGHLARGLVGEGDHQDLVRRHDVGPDRVRRPPADHPRLAGARSGQDRDRAARRDDRLALLRIEVVEQAFGLQSRHQPRLAGVTYAETSARVRRSIARSASTDTWTSSASTTG